MGAATAVAFRDLRGSFAQLPLAFALAVNDINSRYRRTVLGPLWITLGQAATIVGFVLVFSHLLGAQPETYAIYLAAGMPVWMLISQYLSDMPLTFIAAKPFIESFEVPWLTHIWRRSISYVIVFCHHLVVLAAVMIYERVPLHWETLYAIPAVVVLSVAGSGFGILIGVLGARYRGLQPAMTVASGLLFLFSPVMWHADQLHVNEWVVRFNPMYYYISLLRDPLLGHVPPLELWLGTGIGAFALFGLGFLSFVVARRRLYHWL